MKIPYFSLLVVGFASLVLSGCVTETEKVRVAETDQTTKRVHTQEELLKTGDRRRERPWRKSMRRCGRLAALIVATADG